MGHEPDADQRLDAPVRARRSAARGRFPAPQGAGLSKSAASRRFVALSTERMRVWMAADLSRLDLLVIQIDGVHIAEDLTLLAAIGIDGDGVKHPLGLL